MLDLYVSPTPNGMKLKLFMEEAGLPHRLIPVSLSRGEQHRPAFLEISPNGKIPALVDHDPPGGGKPITLFESGALLLYLADKTGRFIPDDTRGRTEVTKWLFWQAAGLGPMAGQAGYYRVFADVEVVHAVDRYTRELSRLYGVLDHRLADRRFIAGDYSIADIATYPWIVPHVPHGQDLEAYPNLNRWFRRVGSRAAVRRAYRGVEDVYSSGPSSMSAADRGWLFGSSAGIRTR